MKNAHATVKRIPSAPMAFALLLWVGVSTIGASNTAQAQAPPAKTVSASPITTQTPAEKIAQPPDSAEAPGPGGNVADAQVNPGASDSSSDTAANPNDNSSAAAQPDDAPPKEGSQQAEGGVTAKTEPTPDPASTGDASDTAPKEADSEAAALSEDAAPVPTGPKDPVALYGLWVIAPAVIAILLAILFRQVIPALVVGVLAGAFMMLPCLPPAEAYMSAEGAAATGLAHYWATAVGGIRLAAEKYVMGAISDPKEGYGHLKIMIFTLVIGFTVGVLGRNGGTAGMVTLIAGNTRSPRRGALTTWLAGLFVFFDDYANTMIVGPTMRSVFDRVKMSRAKLAYIVDSTAAPVASLALIGTWVGAEIGFINTGLEGLAANTPAFLLNAEGTLAMDGMGVFLGSIPYRFYAILALVMVFFVCLFGRDFGPMKRSESRALAAENGEASATSGSESDDDAPEPRWWLGALPVLALVAVTVAILIHGGLNSEKVVALMSSAPDGTSEWTSMTLWERARDVLSGGDAYLSIFYGAILSAVLAVGLTVAARACRVKDAVDAGLDGMARMFPAIVILILAWSLSTVLSETNLGLGIVARENLKVLGFQVQWMPLAIFISAALVSFATGSSWGTMGILCPAVITVSAPMIGAAGLETEQALSLFYACVGSVLAGSIFGDHCSPISDTTVLSSVAAGCPHEEHVWTQLPYALVTAVVAMGVGDVLCSVYKQPWYYGLGAGAGVLLLIVLIVGRRPIPAENHSVIRVPADRLPPPRPPRMGV